jgi:citrate lyase beta subunit
MTAFSRTRSALYLPANRESAIAKARTLLADCIILDLEDAVQPDAKPDARAAAVAAMAAGGWGDRSMLLRVNAVGTPWCTDDFAAARQAGFAGVVVPKVDSAAVTAEAVAAAGGIPIWAMIETPAGVLAAASIAAVPGVAALLAGMADLAKDLRCRPDAARTPLLFSLSAIIVAARAAGVLAIDGVFTDIHNEAGFVAEAEQGLMLGFDGKSLIHPSQVAACNRVFAPSADDIADAQGLIAAYEAGLALGKGVTTFGGKLVEILHVEAARRLLAATSPAGATPSQSSLVP